MAENQDFSVKEHELLEEVIVAMYSGSGFYSKAKLNIEGYLIEVPRVEYPTLQEATTGIMKRVADAVVKFKPDNTVDQSLNERVKSYIEVL